MASRLSRLVLMCCRKCGIVQIWILVSIGEQLRVIFLEPGDNRLSKFVCGFDGQVEFL